MPVPTYTIEQLDVTVYGPTSEKPQGFVEYMLRFTNDDGVEAPFDDRIDADGSEPDLQNEIRKYLVARYVAPPVNVVDPNATFHYSATGELIP